MPLASWVRHASFLTPARMPSPARTEAAATPFFPPFPAPLAPPLPWPPASSAPAPLASLAIGARPRSGTPVPPSVPKWVAATSRTRAAHDAPACQDGRVSTASFETSAQPTPASMEECVWPPTPRSSAAAHPASRAMPANTTSTSVTWTRDPAPRAPPAITPWDPSSVSAPLGGRVHAVDSGRDPAPPGAVSMGAPVNWFQGETPLSTCASVPQASQAQAVR